MTQHTIVVGAGILGLAHALGAARRGDRVTVFERSPQARGASIRNFGMVWPIGQKPGPVLDRALHGRATWLELSREAGFWLHEAGSLFPAYRDDEAAVLREFLESEAAQSFECGWLEPAEALRRTPALKPDGLIGAMSSATECAVDPREALQKLPGWLTAAHDVEFHFATAVTHIDNGTVFTARGQKVEADHVHVCSGDDLVTLYPDLLADGALTRCKLQMMRTAPQPEGWHLGPMLAGGLTLRHYPTFEHCPSVERLRQRVADETPELDQFGIHVMANQNGAGEVLLGDSHEYGMDFTPDETHEIDALMLRELDRWLTLPDPAIAARWHGIYTKPTDGSTEFVASPEPGVTVVTGCNNGMTQAWGLAEELIGARSSHDQRTA